jgi:acetyl-CoA synthetase
MTGDMAVRDGEGYFRFMGRNDDLIKSGGYRIGPAEVEKPSSPWRWRRRP